MYWRKTGLALAAVLFAILIPFVALAAETPAAFPLKDENAVLVSTSDGKLLIGCSSEEAASGIDDLIGVVKLCDHEEHCGATEMVATQYDVPVWGVNEEIPYSDIVWVDGALEITAEKNTYLFGSEEAQKGKIVFNCDGSMVPFKGMTNQTAVNLRKSTSTKSNQVGKLKRGDVLTVIQIVINNVGEHWYEVQLNDGTKGYIRADLLSAATDEVVEAEANVTKNSSGRYISNKKSKVYHRSSCKTLPSSKNIVYLDSKDYAEAKGYRPCKNCDP